MTNRKRKNIKTMTAHVGIFTTLISCGPQIFVLNRSNPKTANYSSLLERNTQTPVKITTCPSVKFKPVQSFDGSWYDISMQIVPQRIQLNIDDIHFEEEDATFFITRQSSLSSPSNAQSLVNIGLSRDTFNPGGLRGYSFQNTFSEANIGNSFALFDSNNWQVMQMDQFNGIWQLYQRNWDHKTERERVILIGTIKSDDVKNACDVIDEQGTGNQIKTPEEVF